MELQTVSHTPIVAFHMAIKWTVECLVWNYKNKSLLNTLLMLPSIWKWNYREALGPVYTPEVMRYMSDNNLWEDYYKDVFNFKGVSNRIDWKSFPNEIVKEN